MYRKYLNLLRGISVNRIGRIGVVLTTTAFICFLFFEMLRIAGVLSNAYIGLITYLLFPGMFLVGLILMPLGWRLHCRSLGRSSREIMNERFDDGEVREGFFGSRLFLTILLLTLVNVLFITGAGFRTVRFMDSANFCGTACHQVMGPEWATYQQSPHARVKCVECHVGEGLGALVNSKLSGLRQMVSATFNTYERPIPTPVHQLRPSRETCEKCHWPDKFYGERLKTITHYANDEGVTPRYTTLSLKIDTGEKTGSAGIHWHVARDRNVRYASVGDRREEMIWVDIRQADGSHKRFENKRLVAAASAEDYGHVRTMDCVDCHNRATHIYENPEHAVDSRLATGLADRSLPFVRREMLAALQAGYPDREAAMTGIERHLYGFYRADYPDRAGSWLDRIDQAVSVARDIYNRNIHPGMKVEWGSYPNHVGHEAGGGCFRCHNPNMQAVDGTSISGDCTLCHSILAYDEPDRFAYLEQPDMKDPNYKMHRFLRTEFLGEDVHEEKPVTEIKNGE